MFFSATWWTLMEQPKCNVKMSKFLKQPISHWVSLNVCSAIWWTFRRNYHQWKTVCHNLNLPKCDIYFTDIVLKLLWYNDLNMILYQELPRLFTRSKWHLLLKVSSGDVQLQFLQDVFKKYWTLQLLTKDKNWTKCDYLMLHSFQWSFNGYSNIWSCMQTCHFNPITHV